MSAPVAEKVVTRFAPSPTGALHVGGARTALFSWAFARHHGGKFILRFEDTDQKRSSHRAAQSILDDLAWLGLDFDAGPFRQSERLDIYNEQIDRLLADGRAYDDDGAVRFGMHSDVAFNDAVYGRVEVKRTELEDFVIKKADGFPTFHLAVVVDDALMGVTHVIRGQEHLSNTPKHAALYDALGYARPIWAHTPSIMNPDGSKMSKRDKAKAARRAAKNRMAENNTNLEMLADEVGATRAVLADYLEGKNDDETTAAMIADRLGVDLPEIDVVDFRNRGYLPHVICNYTSLLGWNPGNDIEQFDLEFLVSHFGLDRIGKSNARFDRQKLRAFNADAIAQMAAECFEGTLRDHFQMHHADMLQQLGADFSAFAGSYQSRSHTLDDPVQLGAFFFLSDDAIGYDNKAVNKVLVKNGGLSMLHDIAGVLEACDDWSSESLDRELKSYAEKHEVGMGKVAQPLRVAVSGGTVSPPIGDTLAILGKKSTLARIRNCLNQPFAAPQTPDFSPQAP